MREDADEEVVGRDESPLLEVPTIDLSRAETPGPYFDPQASGAANPAATNASPARSAPRRGLLGTWFSGLNLNWLRR
jgi:hypothetical protein